MHSNFDNFFLLIFQIENEYGAFGYDDYPRDTQYLHSLKLALESYGMESLLFTSDSPKNSFDYGTTDGGTQCSKIRKKCNFKNTKKYYLHFQKWQKIYFSTEKSPKIPFLVVLNVFLVHKLIFCHF